MNNKLFLVIIVLLVLMFISKPTYEFLKDKLVDDISERVVSELVRDYAPGPYKPGFDPDKVNPNKFTTVPQFKPAVPSNSFPESLDFNQATLGTPRSWNAYWEQQRSSGR